MLVLSPPWLGLGLSSCPRIYYVRVTFYACTPLIGVLPDRQLDLKEVYVYGPERGHERAVGSTQEQQIQVIFQVIAEGQFEPLALVRISTLYQHRTAH